MVHAEDDNELETLPFLLVVSPSFATLLRWWYFT